MGRRQARDDSESGGRDTIIVTGAWTNMSIEHTARTGADKGYFMIVPEDCCSTARATHDKLLRAPQTAPRKLASAPPTSS
jgi:nicotinamidase-related amidase